jgi:hypothetical protein
MYVICFFFSLLLMEVYLKELLDANKKTTTTIILAFVF